MKNKIIFGAIIYLSVAAQAQFVCRDIFFSGLQKRNLIVEQLVKAQVPAVAKPTKHGSIPVILGNIHSFQTLKPLFEKSIGIIVQHQPDYKNDHGMYRLGFNFIDMDSPGYRQRGELHQTGLSWVSVKEYLQYSFGRRSAVRIEVLYKLNDFDYDTAHAYQAMRRAAIVRAPFTFGGGQPNLKLPNMLAAGGEHCFSFCSGTSLRSQIQEMVQKLSSDGFTNLSDVMADKSVQNFLAEAKNEIRHADANNTNVLNNGMAFGLNRPAALLANPIFAMATVQKQVEILNWLIGYKLSSDYHMLLVKLGVNGGNSFEGLNSAEASAVVIYDGMQTAESFQTTNYVSNGIFSTWTQQDAQNLNPTTVPR